MTNKANAPKERPLPVCPAALASFALSDGRARYWLIVMKRYFLLSLNACIISPQILHAVSGVRRKILNLIVDDKNTLLH